MASLLPRRKRWRGLLFILVVGGASATAYVAVCATGVVW
jgi:hypothetical protein